MSGSKDRDKQSADEEQPKASNVNTMIEFAELVSESITEKDPKIADPFEIYAHQLITHLHSDINIFKSRFADGYRILLEELQKEPIA